MKDLSHPARRSFLTTRRHRLQCSIAGRTFHGRPFVQASPCPSHGAAPPTRIDGPTLLHILACVNRHGQSAQGKQTDMPPARKKQAGPTEAQPGPVEERGITSRG